MSKASTVNDTNRHKRLRAIIAAGSGGIFRGVIMVPALPNKPAYYTVYFDSSQTGSTMTMRVRGLTARGVREHIRLSNLKFGIAL